MINQILAQSAQAIVETKGISLTVAVPILTAHLTAGTTFTTMIVRDIFVQNKKIEHFF